LREYGHRKIGVARVRKQREFNRTGSNENLEEVTGQEYGEQEYENPVKGLFPLPRQVPANVVALSTPGSGISTSSGVSANSGVSLNTVSASV
jgi:hypothetical protein